MANEYEGLSPDAVERLRALQQTDQTNRIASAPDELLKLLAEYGLISPQQAFAERQMKEAEAARNTPMPEGQTVRGQFVAPHPLSYLASVMKQVKGGIDAESEKQAVQAGYLRKMAANEAIGKNEKKYARSQQAAQAAQDAAAEPPGFVPSLPVEDPPDTTGMDIQHDLGPYGVRKPKAPAGLLPVVPGQTMTPTKPPGSPYFGFSDILGVNSR